MNLDAGGGAIFFADGAASPTLRLTPGDGSGGETWRARFSTTLACEVSNSCGSVTSEPALLSVFPPYVRACGGIGCEPDYNLDGNVDQADVADLWADVLGGNNPNGRDPDFNGDGNADQDDVAALINVVAGGECP